MKQLKLIFLLTAIVLFAFQFAGCQKEDNSRTVIFKVDPNLKEITNYQICDQEIMKYFFDNKLSTKEIFEYVIDNELFELISVTKSQYIRLIDEKTNQNFTLLPNSIKGFEYEEGYEYRIKVLIYPSPDLPYIEMDSCISEYSEKDLYFGIDYKYDLIEVLSKTKNND